MWLSSFISRARSSCRTLGAVNEHNAVDLDTGAIMLDCDLLESLFSLIGEKGKVVPEKYDRFVNEHARISFYGDFLYPLASESTLEQYQKEKPEGELLYGTGGVPE